jgi:hypothetical protein
LNDTSVHEALAAAPAQQSMSAPAQQTTVAPAQQSMIAPDSLEAVEALRWCEEHNARVIWQQTDPEKPRCTVEVLAPGSSWNLLRGRGADFYAAYRAARGQWATPRSRAA